MDAVTTENREKSTAKAGTEATTKTVGIQSPQTATPAGTEKATMEAPSHHRKIHRPQKIKAFNKDHYCWTHSGNIANDHTSRTCSKQHTSGMHNANATRQNMMGGNHKENHMIKPRDVG